MIGVIALYRTQTTASSFSRRTTEATVLAEDQIERLRLQSGATGGTITETTLDETGKVTATGPFTRAYSATLNGTFYDLIVEVGWTEEGSAKTVKLIGRRNVPN